MAKQALIEFMNRLPWKDRAIVGQVLIVCWVLNCLCWLVGCDGPPVNPKARAASGMSQLQRLSELHAARTGVSE